MFVPAEDGSRNDMTCKPDVSILIYYIHHVILYIGVRGIDKQMYTYMHEQMKYMLVNTHTGSGR